jgi:hypothetical protein
MHGHHRIVQITPGRPDVDKIELQRMAVERREAALVYAAEGWRVLRLYGLKLSKKDNLICDCRAGYKCTKSGKHPIDYGWTRLASDDVVVVGRWWDEHPNANIGLLMGGGLITIDLDLLKPGHVGLNGLEEWERIQEHCGLAPETRTARTGSGGIHFVYREPSGRESGGSLLPALSGAKHIDQRGKGGLIVVAPSLHKSGNRYQWEKEMEPALAPAWLYETPGPFFGNTKKRTRSTKRSAPKSPVTKPARSSDPDIEARAVQLTRQIDGDASLSESTMKLIREGTRGDRSSLIYDICLGAAAVRFDPVELFGLLQDPANHGGERLREEIGNHGPERAMDWFADTWKAAQRYRAGFLLRIDALKEEAETYQWPKTVRYRARPSDFRRVRSTSMELVLDAVFELAGRYTTTEPMLSQKLIGEIARLSTKTVRNALCGLEVLGWLELERKTAVFGADIYSLVVDPEVRKTRLSSPALAEGTFDLLLGPDETSDVPSTPLMAL